MRRALCIFAYALRRASARPQSRVCRRRVCCVNCVCESTKHATTIRYKTKSRAHSPFVRPLSRIGFIYTNKTHSIYPYRAATQTAGLCGHIYTSARAPNSPRRRRLFFWYVSVYVCARQPKAFEKYVVCCCFHSSKCLWRTAHTRHLYTRRQTTKLA